MEVGASADQAQAAASFANEAGATDAVVAQSEGTLGDRLAALLEGPLTAAAEETLAGLPLVALPVKEPGRLMAVIYSGDGGWRDIDKDIAGALQAQGIPVVGVDSLRYFWSEDPGPGGRGPQHDHRALHRGLAAGRTWS